MQRRRAIAIGLVMGSAIATVASCDDPGPGGAADGGIDAAACDRTTPWARGPALPLGPTQETAAVAVDGKVYVLGGFNGALGVVADAQVFDAATCSWSAGPALPMPVHHANVAVVDGTIYVLGAMTTLNFQAVGQVWAWRPATDAGWAPRAEMPAGTARGAAVVGVVGGRVVVAGGLRGGAVAEVAAYDPATDRWDTSLPALPAARDHACGGVIGDTLYVAGGRQGAIESTTATMFAFTPGAGWSTRASMPTARGGTACGVVGDRLIVVGGEGNPAVASGVFADVEAYDPATDRWTTLAPMPTPRHGMGAAAWDGRLYVPGGATRQAFAAAADHEVLTP